MREAGAVADDRCLIRREAEVGENEMAVRRVDDAVAVDVGDRRHVEPVDACVAVHVAGSTEREDVRAGAGDAQRVDSGHGDAEDREAGVRDERLHAVERRGKRRARRTMDVDGKQERAALRESDLALADGERVEIRRPGSEVAVDRVREIVERSSEVSRDRARRDCVAVVDRQTGALAGDERQQVVHVRVPLRRPSREVARSDEVAERVVGVVEHATVGSDDACQPPGSIARERDRFVPRPDDAAVADEKRHTGRGRDRGDAVGDVERPARAGGVGERVLRRVVRAAVGEHVELPSRALERHGQRLELPYDARIGHPGRQEIREAVARDLLWGEREGRASAVGRVDDHTGSGAQGVGGGDVGVEPEVAPHERPPRAEAAAVGGGERVVLPREGERLAAEVGREIGDRVDEAAGERGRCELQLRRRLGAAAGDVRRGEAELVEAREEPRRVERGKRPADRAGPLRERLELRIADARDLERPALEVRVDDAADDRERIGDPRPGDAGVEPDLRRRLVERIPHAQRCRRRADEAVDVGRRRDELIDAGRRSPEDGAPGRIERDRNTVDRERARRHGRERIGEHRNRDGLAGDRGEAGREHDRGRRADRLRVDPELEAALDEALSVADADRDEIAADLSGSGRPGERAGGRIQRRAVREAVRGERERLAGVGVAAADREVQRVTGDDLVVREREGRHAVHVRHADVHHEGVEEPGGVGHLERQHVIAGLVVARRPREAAVRHVEVGAVRQRSGRRVDHGVAVRVGCRQRELERQLLRREKRRQRREDRRLVGRRDGDRDRLGAARSAVRHRQRDARVRAGGEEVRLPAQAARGGIERRARRQPACAPGEDVAVSVDGAELDVEQRVLGDGLVADGQEDGRRIRGARDDVDRPAVATAGRVGDREGDAARARVGSGGRPGEDGRAVDRAGGERGGRRRIPRGEVQRILVEVARAKRELQRQADHGDLGSDRRKQRRLGCRLHLHDERLARREDNVRTAAVAVVGSRDRDDVVTTVADVRRHGQNACAEAEDPARADRLRDPLEGHRDVHGDGVAVGVGRRHRQLEYRALRHRLVDDRREDGSAVRVPHLDRQRQRGRERLARAVAVVRRGEVHGVMAGLSKGWRPRELTGQGVECRAVGQVGGGVRNGRRQPVRTRQ